MATKVRKSFLFSGTPVITDNNIRAFVEFHHSNERVVIRYHRDDWPFPVWAEKTRKQLKIVQEPLPDAMF